MRSHIAGLGAALVARGHAVEVIAPSETGRLESLPVVACGTAKHMAFGGTQIDLTWAPWSRLEAVCRRGYDVMHFHTIWNPLVPFQLAARFRGPKVATFHDVPGPDTPGWASGLMSPASELIRRVALNRVIAVSPSVSRYLSDRHHTIIPNGITVPETLPPEGEREAVLYVGRLEPRKGVRTLIDAAALLGAHAPPIWIAGDGPLRDELERLATSSGLTRIRFFGEVSEEQKWSLLRRAALFVAPSLGGESFGIVLLEAMAAGTPPVAASNPGYRDVLVERSDLLFPPGDARGLADRISALVRNAAKRAAARAWGEQQWRQFDWSVLAEKVESEYSLAANHAAKSPGPLP